MRSYDFYQAYRFVLEVPINNGIIGATKAFSDPFTNGFWIGRGHEEHRHTLDKLLAGATSINVYMFSRMRAPKDGGQVARRITVDFEGYRWYPIDLDATQSDVAIDWVMLKNAQYSSGEDLNIDEIPALVHTLPQAIASGIA